MNLIENHNKEILNLCKAHKVKSLYAFGSVLTDKFNSDSDVDLIVDFENLDVLDYGDNYYNLKFSLENILKRSIDLLEEKAIKNPYFRKTLNQNNYLLKNLQMPRMCRHEVLSIFLEFLELGFFVVRAHWQ